MKLLLILGAFLGLASALPLRSLQDDVSEILALIPVDEIRAVNAKYASDPEIQQVLAYIRSEEFLAIVSAVKATDEYDEAIAYLKDAGLDVDRVLDWIADLLYFGSRSIAAVDSSDELVKSFHGWFNEIRALIPTQEIIALIQEKKQTSTDFQEFLEKLTGDSFKAIVDAVVATSEYQALLDKGREHGAPVDAWIARIYAILGW